MGKPPQECRCHVVAGARLGGSRSGPTGECLFIVTVNHDESRVRERNCHSPCCAISFVESPVVTVEFT
jgi:hypothetical protein